MEEVMIRPTASVFTHPVTHPVDSLSRSQGVGLDTFECPKTMLHSWKWSPQLLYNSPTIRHYVQKIQYLGRKGAYRSQQRPCHDFFP